MRGRYHNQVLAAILGFSDLEVSLLALWVDRLHKYMSIL
jgi:hypothetical protein